MTLDLVPRASARLRDGAMSDDAPPRSLDALTAEAKMRIQRRWPTMMLVDKSLTVSLVEAASLPRPIKELRVIGAQDVEAGIQLLCVVAEQFGSAGEHLALAQHVDQLRSVGTGLLVTVGSAFDPHSQQVSSAIMVSSQVLHVYTDRLAAPLTEIQTAFKPVSLVPIIRDDAYWRAHDESRPPDLFICHDWADKERFVRPLVEALNSRLVKVWYDEHSLCPGDSLVESVERGLREARHALLVLSPHFLANRKWAAREFRSLVTRDISEERRMLIPIWLGVERGAVAAYSLDLADRVAVVVSVGSEPAVIADQVIRTLRLNVPDLGPRAGGGGAR